jgi:hypothetical protein
LDFEAAFEQEQKHDQLLLVSLDRLALGGHDQANYHRGTVVVALAGRSTQRSRQHDQLALEYWKKG